MTKYIFIDDERSSSAYSDLLNRVTADLTVDAYMPSSVSDVTAQLQSGQYHGALLDIAFDHADEGGQPLQVDGLSLAQQIRSLQKRGELAEIPLVRLSQPAKEELYVGGDTSSNDLFDARLSKDKILDETVATGQLLIALAVGYPNLIEFSQSERTDQDIAGILGISIDFIDLIDPRLLLGFTSANSPAHTFARFLLDKVLRRPGPLVNEQRLSVRLGVDSRNSGQGWADLLQLLAPAKYKGCFSLGFQRWWWPQVAAIWSELLPEAGPLARMSADNRVANLAEVTGLNTLVAIPTTPRSPGDKFWTVCAATALPVDPAQGFPLQSEPGHEPWQDIDYLCLEAALRQAGNRRLSSIDRDKLKRIKDTQKVGGARN